jgi:formate dehydrogenase accessory protein FdhE
MHQLRARLDSRLTELAAKRPDLERAAALQRTLLGRQIDMLELFRQGGLPGVSLPRRYLAAKLNRSIPALHAEPIPLPGKVLELSAREYAGHLANGGAGDAATGVCRALDSRELDAAALISACFGRDQRRVRFMAAQHSVSPFAHLLQRQALGGDAAGDCVRAWDRGYCPACGSWPAIVEVVTGRHAMRCSFCAASWELSSYRCIYCSNDGDTFITAAPNAEDAGRRLQMCNGCGGYLKVLELTAPTEFPLVAIEDLASMDLDMLAIERKYMRPALPEIKRR